MKNLSDTITNNIKKHLIQPWPYASSMVMNIEIS